jgi:hypothetical protein
MPSPLVDKAEKLLLRLGISILLLILLLNQINTKSIIAIIKGADKSALFLAFFIFASSYILCIFRWEMLLKAAKIHLPLKRVVISASGGFFFSLFLPSTIGGDLVRSIDLAVHTQKPREVVATVLLDRLSGYVALATVTLFAVLFGWKLIPDKSVLISLGIIMAILVAILLVIFNPFVYSRINKLLHSPRAGKIREYIKNLHQEMHIFRHHTEVVIDNLILSLAIQILGPLTFYIIASALGIKINLAYFFVFIPIIGAITLLPISIGGLGLRDASMIFFFAKAGVGKDLAFAMSLTSFFFIFICGILGGIIYALTVHHRRIQHHPPHHLHHPA